MYTVYSCTSTHTVHVPVRVRIQFSGNDYMGIQGLFSGVCQGSTILNILVWVLTVRSSPHSSTTDWYCMRCMRTEKVRPAGSSTAVDCMHAAAARRQNDVGITCQLASCEPKAWAAPSRPRMAAFRGCRSHGTAPQ